MNLVVDTIGDLLGLIGIGAILSSIVSTWFSYSLSQRRFKREQRIAYLKEKLDNFYSPMLFHFENMHSWAEFGRSPQKHVWADKSLAAKIGDMNNIMRSGMRYVSPKVEKLWYQWQPLAVAAVDKVYPEYRLDDLLSRSQKLHEALLAERDALMKQYRHELGED
jgi:hypothetical protein